MINNLKALHERITALENKVAELEAGPGRPRVSVQLDGTEICRVQLLQKDTGWIDRLSRAIAGAMNGAKHDIP